MHTGMKKAYGIALVLCAFFLLSPFAHAATAKAKKATSVHSAGSIVWSGTLAGKATVRKTPTVSSKNVLATLPAGKTVTVTSSSGAWYGISYDGGKKGWVSKALVHTVSTAANQALASGIKPAITTTSAQVAVVPDTILSGTAQSSASMTEQDVSQYWQQKVNALRATKGLSQLSVRPELIQTSHIWALYLGLFDLITHTRPNGISAEQWAVKQGLPFAKQDVPGGWKKNYFTENIAKKLSVKPDASGVKVALDQVLQMFLDEGPTGLHYQSIYQPDWNSVGVGWYPIDNKNGTYTIVFVMHYASLAS